MSKSIETVLIIGLGSIGERHVEIIGRNFPEVTINVLRHKDCDHAQKNPYISRCFSSLEEAIASQPQVAIVTNPATKHIDVAKKLAAQNIDLIIEKPIADNSKDALELIEICNRQNVLITVAYNLRFLPSLLYFKHCVDSEIIGKLYSIRSEVGQYLPSWRPRVNYKNSVSAIKSLGGGALLELSHEIDYIQWIFGKISWVQAHSSRQSDLEIDVEDSACIILGIESGVNQNLVVSLNIDFIRHDITRKCCAIGEKGTLVWDAISGEVKVFFQGGVEWEILSQSLPDGNYTYTKELSLFFESVRSRSDVCVSADDGVAVVRTVEAIKQSSNTGSKIYL